jgi:uncharacterized protein (TIGR03000 family)
MRRQSGWLAIGLAAVALMCLSSSAMAQGRFGGGTHGGGRTFGGSNGAFRPQYYSTYDPFGYNLFLNRPGFYPVGRAAVGWRGGFGYGFAYDLGYSPSFTPFFGGYSLPPDSYESFYPVTGGPAAQPPWQQPSQVSLPPRAPTAAVQIFTIDPNAELWFNGVKMQQIGQERNFITPELEPGKKYSYEIRAKWTQSGKQYDKTRTITVQAGEQIGLNFVADDRETLPPPALKQ